MCFSSAGPGHVITEACGYLRKQGNETVLVGAAVLRRFTRARDPCMLLKCENAGICGVGFDMRPMCGCAPGTYGYRCEHGKRTEASRKDKTVLQQALIVAGTPMMAPPSGMPGTGPHIMDRWLKKYEGTYTPAFIASYGGKQLLARKILAELTLVVINRITKYCRFTID